MNYTDKYRAMSLGERARQNGYDARYEGKILRPPELFAEGGPLWRAWSEGWRTADAELTGGSNV